MTLEFKDPLSMIEASGTTLGGKLQRIAEFAVADPVAFIRHNSKDICTQIGISEPTLIRFCKKLGYSGLAEFRIDLALALAQQGQRQDMIEPVVQDRRTVNLAAKSQIARIGARLVVGDAAVLVDNGSTAELFAASLGNAPPMTFMTTGLTVAHHLLAHGQHEVMVTGGRIRPNARSMTGRLVDAALVGMRFDTFVMGANSIDPHGGLSTFREDEAHVTRAMVDASARVIVLADRSKFMKPLLRKICDIERVAIVVTDLAPDDPVAQDIAARGVKVISTQDEDRTGHG